MCELHNTSVNFTFGGSGASAQLGTHVSCFGCKMDTKKGVSSACAHHAVGPAKLETFDGLTDVQRFLDHFDVVAVANGWNEEAQRLQLPTALKGAAFDFYRRLTKEEKTDIKALRDALEKEFGACALESDYARLFVSRRRQVGESLSDFAEALKSLGRKAYPSFSAEQLDKLCQSHFINGGLTETLRVQLLVGAKEQESYRELVARARRLEQVLVPSLVRAVATEDSQDQGAAAACSEFKTQLEKLTEAVSALERKVENMQTQRSTGGGGMGSSNRPLNPCPICHQKGHWSRNCPEKGSKKADKVICFKCQQPGHMARGCANF